MNRNVMVQEAPGEALESVPCGGARMRACLFDLDGVLVDTAGYHYQAWRRLARSLGHDFTEAENEQLKGISRIESLKKLLAWAGLDMPENAQQSLAEAKNKDYVSMIEKMRPADVLPGVRPFLESLKAAGYRVALGSASKNAGLILDRTGLRSYFDEIVDGNLVQRSKPDPEVFLTGAKLLGVAVSDCIVFEDAQAGIEAAKRAGMLAIGIGDATILQQADLVIESMSALSLELLQALWAKGNQ